MALHRPRVNYFPPLYYSMNARYKWCNGSINKKIKRVYGDVVCNDRPFKAHFGTSYLDDLDFSIPIA